MWPCSGVSRTRHHGHRCQTSRTPGEYLELIVDDTATPDNEVLVWLVEHLRAATHPRNIVSGLSSFVYAVLDKLSELASKCRSNPTYSAMHVVERCLTSHLNGSWQRQVR
ncbi:MAG: hypothetical protein QF515_10525 [Pseudomonadales bacterium]|jgi:hypothetical protein|nr:hypothetical protein [Pseudomonadales bacterium]MDP6827528.1 hypothetical protein [Pseudomonadales bacterium]